MRALSAIIWLAILAFAAWMRWPGIEAGYTPDEVYTMECCGLLDIWRDPETGVNPPLWRWVLNLPFDSTVAMTAGRWMSFLMNLAVVPLMGFVATRAAKHPAAGWLAAMWWAVQPEVLRVSSQTRSYSLAALLTMGFFACIPAAAKGDKRAKWGVALCAIAMSWTHYYTVPILIGVGLAWLWSDRKLFMLLIPSGVAFLPLGFTILSEPGRRVPPTTAPWEQLLKLSSMELRMPGWHGQQSHLALFVVGAVLVIIWALQDRTPLRRALIGATVGIAAGIFVFNHVQYVRRPASTMMLVVLAPTIAAAITSLRPMAVRAVAVAAALYIGQQSYAERMPYLARERVAQKAPEKVRDAIQSGSLEKEALVYVHPEWQVGVLYHYLTGGNPRRVQQSENCPAANCIPLADVELRGVRNAADAEAGQPVVSFWQGNPPATPEGCSLTHREPGVDFLVCGG